MVLLSSPDVEVDEKVGVVVSKVRVLFSRVR